MSSSKFNTDIDCESVSDQEPVIAADEIGYKDYNIKPLREALLVGFVVFSVTMLTTYFILYHALNAEKAEISEGMLRQAKIVATLIDGEQHKTFTDPSQESSPEYQQAIEPLKRALLESCDRRLETFEQLLEKQSGCSLIFIYTVILRNDEIYYILDPWPSGIFSPDAPGVEMKSDIMEHYPEATPQMYQALTQRMATTTDVFHDVWGSFISAYAPFYDSEGEFVGIVGVDMRADTYLKRLEPIKTAAQRTFVCLFFVSYVMAATVWFLRNFSLQLNRKRYALYRFYLRKSQQ